MSLRLETIDVSAEQGALRPQWIPPKSGVKWDALEKPEMIASKMKFQPELSFKRLSINYADCLTDPTKNAEKNAPLFAPAQKQLGRLGKMHAIEAHILECILSKQVVSSGHKCTVILFMFWQSHNLKHFARTA